MLFPLSMTFNYHIMQAYGVVVAEVVLVLRPELHPDDAGINSPDTMHVFYNKRLLRCFAQDHILITFVVCLLRFAKQFAQGLHGIALGVLRMQGLYRVASDFFLMGTLKVDSARSIIVL